MSGTGMMDPAFFVGKNAILKWLNDTFQIGYTKIEQTCTGAIHCQILDALYSNVPLHKVNFDAKQDYEYVANYKVLQSVFDAENITKHIDVPKLIKGKYQDNLEFCQWIKKYFDDRYNPNTNYNGVERREQARAQYKKGHKHAGTSKIGTTGTKPTATTTTVKSTVQPTVTATKQSTNTPLKRITGNSKPNVTKSNTSKPTTPNKSSSTVQSDELAKLQLTLDTMQKERDFYFGKLREIEILCQTEDSEPSIQQIKKQVLDILYHSDEPEFQSPVDESVTDITQNTDNIQINDENKEATDDGLLAL